MKFSLRVKLSAAFLLVAFLLFLFISIFANSFLKKQFTEYTINKQNQEISSAVSLITNRYQSWGDKWDVTGIENIGVNLLGNGLIIRVKDKNDSVLWDARVHNNGMCTSILEHMAQNMQTYNANFQGGYVEQNYPVTVNNMQVGSVDIGYYGPYFYSDIDMQFLQTLNNLLWLAAALSLLICIFFGVYMARRLTKPIGRVINTTGKIAKGDFEDRIHEKSSTKEIIELTESVNSLAQTLGKQELLRKRLTADVAHELRTPLATLQSHIEALIDGIWEPDQNRLESCHEEILRLSKLVGELETLSRYEGENLVLHKEWFELSVLAKHVISNFENQFKSKGITLACQGQEVWLEADKDKISQVIVNLLSNAYKYTPEGGTVEIEINNLQDSVRMSVSDTGIGIADEDLPYIFERFYRTDISRNRLTGGSGIGLTITKSIVEAHNGKITVQSKLNKGSLFIVILPVNHFLDNLESS